MKRMCDSADWEHVPEHLRPLGAPCGATYDDVDHSTICPHVKLPPRGPVIGPDGRNRPDPDMTPRENRPHTNLDQE